MIDKALFLFFYGRSGSMFMESLLHGHPQLIIFPFGLISYLGVIYHSYDSSNDFHLSTVLEEYEPELLDCVEKGKGIQFLNKEFNRMMQQKDGANYHLFVCAITIAVHTSLGYSFAHGTRIVLHIHDPSHSDLTSKLANCFSDSLFLHLIREPIQSLGSHFMHYYKEQTDLIHERGAFILQWLYDGILCRGIPILSQYASSTRAIKLEDLKSNPMETMQTFCEWIGINYDEALLQSTRWGESYDFPTSSGVVHGFDTTPLQRTHSECISPFDRLRLKVLLAEKKLFWEYPTALIYRLTLSKMIVLPLLLFNFKMEGMVYPLCCSSYKYFLSSSNVSTGEEKVCADKSLAVDWWRMRKILFSAWLSLFFVDRPEIKLLSKSDASDCQTGDSNQTGT